MSQCCDFEGSVDGSVTDEPSPFTWFDNMIEHCHTYASQAEQDGRPIVGIMCEYTPREILLAAGCVPVCLCGGDPGTIPAAEQRLPANLCPLIKSTFGYHVKQANPFLAMADLIVAETTCDGKKKMYELMAEDRDVYVLHLPQKANDHESRGLWIKELQAFIRFLENRYSIELSDAALRSAITVMNRERALRRTLARFMTQPQPPLSGRHLLDLKSIISGMPALTAHLEQAVQTLADGHARRAPTAHVRVLLTGVPTVHGAERVVELIEERGGLIVAAENCTGLKPILDDVCETDENALHALADKYYQLPCSVMTTNERRFEVLNDLVQTYRPDCIVDLVWQACLTYDVESQRVKQLSRTLGLPYLRIETDYSPSDSARIAVRLEALFETVRAGSGTT